MKKRFLLISDHPDDASFVNEISAGLQAELTIAADAKSGVDFLAENECAAIFVDVTKIAALRDFEFEAQKRFGLFSDQLQPNQIHFIGSEDIFLNRDAVLSPLFGNFYQRHTENLQENAQYYGRFVVAGEHKATHDLSHFLSAQGGVQKVTLTNSNQKLDAAEAVRQYLIAAKIPARISNIIANSVDEILMNALFDAPCDEFGKALYTTTARNESRELTEKERVTMSIGFDGFYVGVSVADSFGSIDRNRLLTHISSNYRNRDYQIRQGQAGAGLGISNVFHSGGTLIYHCEAHIKTETTLLYRAFPNYREFKNQFKFFSAKFYI